MKLSPLPVVFSYKGFHVNMVFFLYFVFLYYVSDHNKWYQYHWVFSILSMATMKYEIPLLDRNTRFSLWQVKMRIVLTQMNMDDALLGIDKMSSSLTKEDKERKDRKVISQIHLHLSNWILQDVLNEKTKDALWLKLEELCMKKSLTSK